MSRATFTLFDDNRLLHQSNLPEAGTDDLLAFSGELLSPINVEDVRSVRTLWVCVGSRSDEVRVTITYTGAGEQIFLVSPGRPMVLETLSAEVDTISSITIAPSRQSATVEILVYPGFETEPPTFPADYFLHLNAAGGVERDGDGRVLSWVDARVLATTQPFDSGEFAPLYVESHNGFNDQPAVQFSNVTDVRLISTDDPGVYEFLATGPFTMAMVCSSLDAGTEQQFISNQSPGNGGFMVALDGGFRTIHEITDDAGVPNNENTVIQEMAGVPGNSTLGRAFIYVIRYDGARTIVYRQGIETIAIDTGPPATSVAALLTLGGSPAGGSLGGITIADLRIWNYEIDNDSVAGYIQFATGQFGINSQPAAQAPKLAENIYMLRSNRGVEIPATLITEWNDTRPEITLSPMGSPPGTKTTPTFNFSDDELDSQPSLIFGLRSGMRYTGPAVDFNLMGGADGDWTVAVVMVPLEEEAVAGLLSATEGATPGLNVLMGLSNALTVQMRNETDFIASQVLPNHIQRQTAQVLFIGMAEDDPGVLLVRVRGIEGRPDARLTITGVPGGDVGGALMIGERDSFNSAPMRIAEFRVYNQLVDGSDRAQFMAYTLERYGIPDPL